MRTNAIALVLALGSVAATGCATNGEVGDTGGDHGGGDDGSDDVGNAPATLAGKYELTSTFDIATAMPGAVGAITNVFIDATDDSSDPADYLVGLAISGISNSTIRSVLEGLRPIAAGYVQAQLNQIAPTFVTRMLAVSNHFGDVMHNFGTASRLELVASGADYVATHTVTGLRFRVDGAYQDFAFADYASYQMNDIVVAGVGVTLAQTGKVSIASHQIPVSFGRIANLVLDEVIIPAVDPTAHDFADLLNNAIDCESLGQAIDDNSSNFLLDATLIATACHAGIDVAVNQFYTKLDNLDTSALLFDIDGSARAVDTVGNDGIADELRTGGWAGDLSYAGTASTLTQTDSFYGSKL